MKTPHLTAVMRLIPVALSTSLTLALLGPTARADFSGPYDTGNWNLQNTGANDDGAVDFGGVPASVVLTGGDNGSGEEGFTLFTITSAGSGLMSFDWTTTHPDPGFDFLGYIVGDEFFELTDDEDDGSETVLVCPGQTIGFYVETPDNDTGAPTLTITNFSGPTNNPWTNLGGGIRGSFGPPILEPCGSLIGNEPVRVTTSAGIPFGTSFWIYSLNSISVPLKGGVLVPDPSLNTIVPLPLNDEGRFTLNGVWPPGLPGGVSFFMQFWAPDPGAAQGFSATDGWQGTTP